MNFTDPKQMLDDITAKTDKNGDGIRDAHERKLQGPELTPELAIPQTFWDKPLVRTIRGKNRAGKILYGVLTVGISVATGLNIEPLTDFITGNQTGIIPTNGSIMELDILNLILIAVGAIISFLTTRGLLKGLVNEIAAEVAQLFGVLRKVREADSSGGKQITKEEKLLLLKEAEDIATLIWKRLLRSRLLRILGLDATKLSSDRNK